MERDGMAREGKSSLRAVACREGRGMVGEEGLSVKEKGMGMVSGSKEGGIMRGRISLCCIVALVRENRC